MSSDIKDYEFQSFSSRPLNSEVEEYEFQGFEGLSIREIEKKQDIIRVEREKIKESAFDLNPIVHKARGFKNQEDTDFEERVQAEVEKRVAELAQAAHAEGLEIGRKEGQEEARAELTTGTEEKILFLNDMIEDVLSSKVNLLANQKMQTYSLLRNLSKWIILRELKDDGEYIIRLLEKLIVEAQAKSNLLVRVNEKHFEQMPDVLEIVQQRVGELANVRVEIDYDIEAPGIIVESGNGIVNGELKTQLDSLDKLYESIGLAATNENSSLNEEVPSEEISKEDDVDEPE